MPEARQAAEGRLQALAVAHSVWPFILTSVEGDPPRMLDGPMSMADGERVPAVAIMLRPGRIVGTGYSESWSESPLSRFSFTPPSVDAILMEDPDAALDHIVDHLEAWFSSPTLGPRPPAAEPEPAPSAP